MWKKKVPIGKVAQVVEQLAVILHHQIRPGEGGILRLGSDVEQVEAPNVSWDARLLSIVAKDAHSAALGEFAILVVEILFKVSKQ